jgi:hypothetical protein
VIFVILDLNEQLGGLITVNRHSLERVVESMAK